MRSITAGGIALVIYLLGYFVGRIFPVIPFLANDIKRSILLLPPKSRKTLLKWLTKEIKEAV